MKDNNLESRYHEAEKITSLKQMLKVSAEKYNERPAFLVKKEKGGYYEGIKYKQLKNDVDALGTALLNMGYGGSKIAIIGENCYEWITTYLAVVNGAGVVVPLDKELNQEEIYNLIATAECSAVFLLIRTKTSLRLIR